MLTIQPIPAFNDNYIWCISNQQKQAVVVDPGSAVEVIRFLEKQQLVLVGILITHHHADHIGGIEELLSSYDTNIQVYGPNSKRIPQITHIVDDKTPIFINELGVSAQVINVTGHTLEHIAYLIDGNLFCGDTLFSGGCGRIFEGTAEQMFTSLEKLSALPSATKVFCAHEYTLSNLTFALMAEPSNSLLLDYYDQVKQQRQNNEITLPSSIGKELEINPFLRCDQAEIQSKVSTKFNLSTSLDTIDCFTYLRKWKDIF
ncbi:hydroxyacylglutathione hydrolase [Parashewanella curva]|uniref:Hydroxyacylglutathione hydrolase n=1 Tax=Parashewanella curva TaxID=2338552 RepID=A0A3L8Q0H7_9GAMM|nr:hydroxyacylglutathione hydrolase [Parashewanella curva]RLV61196.1 hydroxyacylglutathione hydrolase [Parashewanella curva]